jgi:hypothetical protein
MHIVVSEVVPRRPPTSTDRTNQEHPAMAELSLETVTNVARDAFYVGVGAGVIAVQKLQVQRVELTKALGTQFDDAKERLDEAKDNAEKSFESVSELVEDRVKLLEERLAAMETRLETALAQLEDKLPEQARDLVKQARELVGLAA